MIGNVGTGPFAGVTFHQPVDSARGAGSSRSSRAERVQGLRRREGVREFIRDTSALHEEAMDLHRAMRAISRRGGSGAAGEVRSTGRIGLLDGPTGETTLRSSEEINTAATSFSASTTEFDGNSTVTAEVGGVYTGTTDDTLTFRSNRDGYIGLSALNITLKDSAGVQIDRVEVGATQPAGVPISFSNGMTLTLSNGILERYDDLDVQVFASVPGAVDPTQPMNGIGPDDAHLDDGVEVTSGSFEIEGETISVAASDSIQDVLDAINAAAVGVTATFDEDSEAVVLTRDAVGPTAITLANDTSGFLAATKLSPGSETLGFTGGAAGQLLSGLAPFSGVSAGSVEINGVSIALDPATDSLSDFLDRINASGAGATATYSAYADRVSLSSDDPTAGLTVSSDTTGILAALNLVEGTYAARSGRTSSRAAGDIATRTRDFAAALNEAFRPVAQEAAASTTFAGARGRLRSAMVRPFGADPDSHTTRFGVGFSLDRLTEGGASSQPVMAFGDSDAHALKRALVSRSDDAMEFLLGERQRGSRQRSENGLFISVARSIEAFQNSLATLVDGVQPGVSRAA